MIQPPALIGDMIENPWNALTLLHAAEMLGSTCLFRHRKAPSDSWKQALTREDEFPCITTEAIRANYTTIVVCDTLEHASDIYGFRLAKPEAAALVVGNERLGISRDIEAMAQYAVRIPMVSPHIRCLNVAAAAAVGSYYLRRDVGPRQQIRSNPHKKRPDVCLMGARDHIELGSSIRSACAFGWERALVEDRFSAWFGTDRVTRSEARGAARRGHNPIRLIPITQQVRLTYNEVTVVNVQGRGRPLHRTNLARGANQLIVIPDESELRLDGEDWERFGQHIEFTHLDLPGATFVYHYRLIASIAMAEVARQVGQKPRKPGRQPREGRLQYDKALQPRMEPQGEIVYLEDLMEY